LAHPTYADAYYGRGYVYFLQKKYDKALEDFTRAYELNPHSARATFMLGSLYEYKGDTTRGDFLLRKDPPVRLYLHRSSKSLARTQS
jgi:tetratricopeptide (TPR) repeat protein